LVDKDDFYVVVVKSKYEINIYNADDELMVTFPAVFGKNNFGDKLYEGDRRTPEGTFHIVNKRIHPKWDRFMGLDYPTAENTAMFNQRKAQGIIPKNAKIGGGIGIHGTWPNEDFAVDAHQNWTLGCVSTKNDFIRQIYDNLPIGTRVEIVP
jgi:murein L,D-transpeptidase YafK